MLLVENKIINNQFIEILSQTDKYLLFKSFTLKKINKIGVSSRFILYFTPFALSLQQIRSCRLDWDTHQIIMKTGISSSANGGPQHLRV